MLLLILWPPPKPFIFFFLGPPFVQIENKEDIHCCEFWIPSGSKFNYLIVSVGMILTTSNRKLTCLNSKRGLSSYGTRGRTAVEFRQWLNQWFIEVIKDLDSFYLCTLFPVTEMSLVSFPPYWKISAIAPRSTSRHQIPSRRKGTLPSLFVG